MGRLFIEAESLIHLGGWVVDTASAETIGSAYIMAHGMGIPVEDAYGEIEIDDEGCVAKSFPGFQEAWRAIR